MCALVCAWVGLAACAGAGPETRDVLGPRAQPVEPTPTMAPDEAPAPEDAVIEATEFEGSEVEGVELEGVEPIPDAASVCPNWGGGTRLALHAASPRRVPRVAALTFDDGPDPDKTPKILDILASGGIAATFFVTGRSINAHTYGLLQRMEAEGHTLANHGYFHSHGLVTQRDEEGRSMIGRNFLLNQAIVDVALLARSPEDFKDLYGRLFGVPYPRYPRHVLKRGWPALLKAWAEILDERSSGRSPTPMHFARLPGGAPYVGKHWRGGHIQAADAELARLGLVHVLWHSGVGDADPGRPVEELRDPMRLSAALDKAVTEGGIITLHDRAPVAHLNSVLPRRAPTVEFVDLDHYLERAYGCRATQARASLWLEHADAFDGSLCPWFCAEGLAPLAPSKDTPPDGPPVDGEAPDGEAAPLVEDDPSSDGR